MINKKDQGLLAKLIDVLWSLGTYMVGEDCITQAVI